MSDKMRRYRLGHDGKMWPDERGPYIVAELKHQINDSLAWQSGMKVMLEHLADKLSADAWTDSKGEPITKDDMVAEVASNLRVLAAGCRAALEAGDE